MTSKEILEIAMWTDPNQITFDIFSSLFKKIIKIIIVFDENEEKSTISEITLDTINEFLALEEKEIEVIQEEIWQHCLGCNRATRSSFDGGKTWVESKLEDNLAEYAIKTKEDALKQSSVEYIFIANKWAFEGEDRIFWLSVSTTWDGEHGINFTYLNGKLDSVT